jgi:hypothetical protein
MHEEDIAKALAEAALKADERSWRYNVRRAETEKPLRLFAVTGESMEIRVNTEIDILRDSGRRVSKIDTATVEHHGNLCFIVTIWHDDATVSWRGDEEE